jgi:hypothetical protein
MALTESASGSIDGQDQPLCPMAGGASSQYPTDHPHEYEAAKKIA